MKPDTGPTTTYSSGTQHLRIPKLARPGKLAPKQPKKAPMPKAIRPNLGAVKAKNSTVPLSSLLRPRRMKI